MPEETGVGEQELAEPSIRDVYAAAHRIQRDLYPIAPRRSVSLSEKLEREVWLIPECLQRTGSFKFRGALNRMYLQREAGGNRVITASSGNHAIGLTTAAAICGLDAIVVVPEGASPAKLRRLETLGANVIVMGNGFDEAEDLMFEYGEKHGIDIVNSFDFDVIAGHGTVALEAVTQMPELEVLISPVASGGLIAGCSIVMKAVNPSSSVVGIQTRSWPAMKESLRRGAITEVSGNDTIADGLAGNATRSHLPFQIIRRNVDDILLVNEDEILRGVWHGLVEEQLVLEGAGAVSIAALLSCPALPGDGPVGLVLSGGNVSEHVLSRAMSTTATMPSG